MQISKVYIAIIPLLIMYLPLASACDDLLIKKGIKDLGFYGSKTSNGICEAYYDSPDLAYEATVRIVEWETKERAKEMILSEVNSGTLIRKFGDKFFYYKASSQEHYRWQYDVYTILVWGDIDFKADDCDGFLCLVKEYNDRIGNEMEAIFPDSSCDKWQKMLFDGVMQDVCVEYYDEVYPGEVNPIIYCKNVLDCPGEGKTILSKNSKYPEFETNPRTYYTFRCDNHRCRYDKRISNECMNDIDCNENKRCDLAQTPTRCVQCLKDIHCEYNEVCSEGHCQKLLCKNNQKAENHRCKDIVCLQNYFAFNHSCFECNGDESSDGVNCIKLDCPGVQYSFNHSCINLTCEDYEVPENHNCMKLSCKDDESASNHKCNKLVCNLLTEPRRNKCSINYKVLSLISLGIILFILSIIVLAVRKRR